MKILQLGKFYPLQGGVDRVMYDLTVGLSRRGLSCDMLCADSDGHPRTEVVYGDSRIISCRTLAKLDGTMISPAMILMLRRICKEYDIIHVHHPDPMAGIALLLSGYKGRVILHWHSDVIKQRIMLKFYLPLQNWLLRRADTVIQTSPVYVTGSEALQSVRGKLICLPIGVEPLVPDSERVRRLRDNFRGRKIVFALGRLVPYKGMEYLIKAAQILGDDYVILIGGTGPMKEELNAEIDRCSLQKKVVMLGRVPEEDLPTYFGACDLFCMPSVTKNEAFGIVQIQAMSCAKPVVTTNIPGSGVPWVNADGVSGRNVATCSPSALSEAIMSILESPSERERLSRGARERYLSVFTYDRMIDECLKIYNNS